MTKNRIRELRISRGFSHAQLAGLAGTTKQQIQLIEAGVQTVKQQLAARICAALGVKMTEAFSIPTSTRPPKKGVGIEDKRYSDAMQKAGIDIDPCYWLVKLRLRGGEEVIYPISGPDKDRLWNAVQRDRTDQRFVVFDSDAQRIVLNLDHLLFIHFIFEPMPPPPEEAENVDRGLIFRFADGSAVAEFGVDPPGIVDEDGMNQMQSLISELENMTDDVQTVHFEDQDGEYVWLRGSDIALLDMPLWAVEQAVLDAELEDEEEKGRAQ